MTPKLPAHEWLIICLLITALLLLSFVTLIWRKDELPPIQSTHDLTMELVQVTVQGAVERAGIYELKKRVQAERVMGFVPASSGCRSQPL